MSQEESTAEAVSLLQELGLQEYEARCFAALTQITQGTAKEIHEISDVPRTRVYDAVRVLESQGLVEVQHTSPQQFRSVGIEEATQTLRRKFDDRIDTLQTHLEETDAHGTTTGDGEVQEVWSLTGHEAIESRMYDIVEDAESEIAMIVVDETMLTETLFDRLQTAADRDVSIVVGGKTDAITSRLGAELSESQIFETGLDWLLDSDVSPKAAVSRIVLVDRETLLIGSYYPNTPQREADEQAVFARGLTNGVVVIVRRLIATGLASARDPDA